ncbi:hypothetical protein [Peribacillus huizhouensis]|uniref:YjzC family protein n=1 Tax=Peribacillus huizhouensis TaxID=1501239 RepID=A0ABR6CPX8_9BACI|nr:hypothetical protein [Peribacillus huizhouensis]MBA9027089.1 hypothetical protein [Peribacillus huizhouensis]
MSTFVKSNLTAPISGNYVEVGQGGGKIKRAQIFEAKEGTELPELKAYTIKLLHKGKEKSVERQHQWKLIK